VAIFYSDKGASIPNITIQWTDIDDSSYSADGLMKEFSNQNLNNISKENINNKYSTNIGSDDFRYDEQNKVIIRRLNAVVNGNEITVNTASFLGKNGIAQVMMACKTEDQEKFSNSFDSLATSFHFDDGFSYSK